MIEPVRLESLFSSEAIPVPGGLPFGSRMSLEPNPLFTGREEELRTLAGLLVPDKDVAAQVRLVAVTGVLGVGKTQLASEFVYRYGRLFSGGVFWISFSDPDGVPLEVAESGRPLLLDPDYEALPLQRQVELVRKYWESEIPRLLVFDNCNDPRLLKDWRPLFGNARVLLTSTQPLWDATLAVTTLSLSILPRRASIDLLRRLRPDIPEEEPALGEIAAELGDLPIALHLAGAFLHRFKDVPFGQPVAYLEQLRGANLLGHPSLKSSFEAISPTNHETHLARTFALSCQRLDPAKTVDNLARKLLARAALLAPSVPIPRSLLLATLGPPNPDLETQIRHEEALKLLRGLGLLEAQAGALFLHGLLSIFVRRQLVGQDDIDAVEDTLLRLAQYINQSERRAPLRGWVQHLRQFMHLFSEREDLRMALLWNELGIHLGHVGNRPEALNCMQRSLAIRRREFGIKHPQIANSLNNVGCLHREMGNFSEALGPLQTALAIRMAILGRRHSATAQSLNNLGQAYQEVRAYEKARRCFCWAIEIREDLLGPDHEETGIVLNNLGLLLEEVGELDEAEVLLRRAVTIAETRFDRGHPQLARMINNLANILHSKGKFEEARRLYKRSLIIRRNAFGMLHPDVARILHNLGCVEGSLGRSEAARCLLTAALKIRLRVLGDDHPETGLNLDVLGQYYLSVEDLEGARSCFGRSKEIFLQRFGADDPRTIEAEENLRKI